MATGELAASVRTRNGQSTEREVVFAVLSNRRRRLVVRMLREVDTPLDIGTLAVRIAAREHGVEPTAVTHRQRKSVYTSLHQNHLPKLADAGFVVVDREWTGIRLTDRASVLESHLDSMGAKDKAEPDSEESRPLWRVALVTGLSVTTVVGLVPGSTLASVVSAAGTAVCATIVCYYSTVCN